MPSPRRVRSASRTGVMLTPSSAAVSSSRMKVPGRSVPDHDAGPQTRGDLVGKLFAPHRTPAPRVRGFAGAFTGSPVRLAWGCTRAAEAIV